MKPIMKVIISIGLLLVLTLGFYYITKTISSVTGKSILGWIIKEDDCEKDVDKLECFAKCLTDKGIVLYSNPGCPHCKAQKQDFEDAVQYLNIIECSQNPEKCSQLRGVPAWEIQGQEELIYGRQSLKKLSELSGCEL